MAGYYQATKLLLTCSIGLVLLHTVGLRWVYVEERISNNLSISAKKFETTSTNENNLESCTFRSISDHLRVNGKFIYSGRWIGHNNGHISNTTRGYYDPEFCLLKRKEDNSPWLSSCLYETKTKNILILGDSNGRKATDAFLRTLEEREGFNCEETLNRTKRGREGYLEMNVRTKNKCSWLYERNFLCKKMIGYDLSSTLTVNVNYAQLYWLSEKVSFVNNRTAHCPDVVNTSVSTIQEYILGEFAERTKPDLIILGATAHTRYKSVKWWTVQQKWLMDKVSTLLPTSTSVVWLSHMSWRLDKIPSYKPTVVKDGGESLTVNQEVLRQNIRFHQLLSERLANNHTRVQVLPFFDMYNISLPVQQPWYEDFVHCHRYFYNGLQDALFETFCNSFMDHKNRDKQADNFSHLNRL